MNDFAIARRVEGHPENHDEAPVALATRVAGRGLAVEVEEYFERGARVERGDVVLDVGANVGAFAAAVAARTGSDVTIHCFEPAVPIFGTLERAFKETPELSATRNELHPIALTRGELHGGERTFYYFSRFPTDSTYDLDRKMDEFALFLGKKGREVEAALGGWGTIGRLVGACIRALGARVCRSDNPFGVWLVLQAAGMRVLPCRLASIERVVAARSIDRVDLLKIDVEGAELDVLHGCGAAWPIINRVAVETDARNGRALEVIALLERAGLRITSCAPPAVASLGDAQQVLILAEREGVVDARERPLTAKALPST